MTRAKTSAKTSAMTSGVTLEHEAQPRQTNTVVFPAHGSPPALDASPAMTPPLPCHHTLALLTHTFARTHLLLPVRNQQGTLSALVAATDAAAPHHASHAEGLHTLMAVLRLAGHATDAESLMRPDATIPVDAEALAQQIDNAFATQPDAHDHAPCGPGAPGDAEMPDIHAHVAGDMLPDLDTALADARRAADADVLTFEGKSPIVRLVDAMLFAAITQGASDIHIQPLPDIALIRYRIDGVLITARRIPAALAAAVTSRIKIMSRLDVAETRAPQDGRAAVTLGPAQRRRSIDLRISIIPSATGQRVVIRLLDTQRGTRLASIDSLAMPTDVQTTFLDRAARASGIILATGPTGSGKTTTLYAALRWIATRTALGARTSSQAGASLETPSTVNILTIEDPIEYDLSAPHSAAGARLPISQTQVDPFKNVTFASGLRHILRQDPDVIMVGEIRDAETARMAVQASLTGHLVFSTLHTNDAPTAIPRLIDLGVEPFLLASSLSCVLAQRLVRLSHQPCAGAGCVGCLHSGYLGRRGIYELLCVDSPIRALITADIDADTLRRAALAAGMRTLQVEGMSLVGVGLTTLQEVHRVTRAGATSDETSSSPEVLP